MKHIHYGLKKMMVLLLSALMILSLGGCGKSNDMILYCSKQDEVLMEVDSLSEQLQEIINDLNAAIGRTDKEAYEASLAELQTCAQTLINDYHALANQTPPEEYKEQQKQLKAYADDIERMLSNCVRMYTLAEERINGGMSNDTTEQINKLTAEIAAQTESAKAFDAILCEIMEISPDGGNTSKDKSEEQEEEDDASKDSENKSK